MKRSRTCMNISDLALSKKRSCSTPDFSALRKHSETAAFERPTTIANFLQLELSAAEACAVAPRRSGIALAGHAAGPSRVRFAAAIGAAPLSTWRANSEATDGPLGVTHSRSINQLVILEHPSQCSEDDDEWWSAPRATPAAAAAAGTADSASRLSIPEAFEADGADEPVVCTCGGAGGSGLFNRDFCNCSDHGGADSCDSSGGQADDAPPEQIGWWIDEDDGEDDGWSAEGAASSGSLLDSDGNFGCQEDPFQIGESASAVVVSPERERPPHPPRQGEQRLAATAATAAAAVARPMDAVQARSCRADVVVSAVSAATPFPVVATPAAANGGIRFGADCLWAPPGGIAAAAVPPPLAYAMRRRWTPPGEDMASLLKLDCLRLDADPASPRILCSTA